jgi:hypothetical protein
MIVIIEDIFSEILHLAVPQMIYVLYLHGVGFVYFYFKLHFKKENCVSNVQYCTVQTYVQLSYHR